MVTSRTYDIENTLDDPVRVIFQFSGMIYDKVK